MSNAPSVPLDKLLVVLGNMTAKYAEERTRFDFVGLMSKQTAVLGGIVPQAGIDVLTQLYIASRDLKSAAKKQFDAEAAEFDRKLAMIATELKARALAEGVDGFKTEFGTVYMSETMKVTGSDWGAFGEFLKTHDPLEFMEKRISDTAVKGYMKDHNGELPSGVSIFKEVEARVRRNNEK